MKLTSTTLCIAALLLAFSARAQAQPLPFWGDEGEGTQKGAVMPVQWVAQAGDSEAAKAPIKATGDGTEAKKSTAKGAQCTSDEECTEGTFCKEDVDRCVERLDRGEAGLGVLEDVALPRVGRLEGRQPALHGLTVDAIEELRQPAPR